MVFSSAVFLFVFFPSLFVLYRLVPGQRGKNVLLIIASLLFYSFGRLSYLPLLIISAAVNYFCGLGLGSRGGRRKFWAGLAIVLDIGILCAFKYLDFFVSNINALTGVDLSLPGIALPIGISFFTFQGLSYVIDVYRRPEELCRDPLKLLLYISFFPQLIAGPIIKFHDIQAQIDSRVCTQELTLMGIRRFVIGLSKKLLLANSAGYIADAVFALDFAVLDWRLAWLGAICYTFQIYFDFSGYSDMAIGLGRMFGFNILENFDHPFMSSSITEFWRRWHISLTSWFRDYLYIPLGGNRRGRTRTGLNKLIVFFCTGLWHGANWTFVLWGLWHGMLASLETLGWVKRLQGSLPGRVICHIYAMLAVVLGFVMFRADSLTAGAVMIGRMFSGFSAGPASLLVVQRLLDSAAILTLVICAVASVDLREPFSRLKYSQAISGVCTALLFVLCVLNLAGAGFNPFIYFRF